MELTLKPCPFCGSGARISFYYTDVLIHCNGCGCYFIGKARGITKDDAERRIIEKWNRRNKNEIRNNKSK